MAKELKQKYNMSFPELILHANNVQTFMVRDTTEFANYGIDSAEIAQFRTDINELEDLPIDDEMVNAVSMAANDKNAKREEIETMLRAIEQRGKLAFGTSDRKYRDLRMMGMTKEKDAEFLTKSRRIKRFCDEYLTDMAAAGLTQTMIDDLETANQELEDALDLQANAIADRDEATEMRITKGNAVYEKLMRYCETGKTIWFGVSEAKYNDYLTYSMPPGVPGKIQNLAYEKTSGAASWSQEPTATTYQLEYAPDTGGEPVWTVIYEGPGTTYTYDPGGPDDYLFRCRGKNEKGYGYWSDVLTVERP
jgi:hypothetical protein